VACFADGADGIDRYHNGLAAAGWTDSSKYVDEVGTASTGVWKWVNITKNDFSGGKVGPFYVTADSLTKTFQIGSREDGLDIDKLAFGKSYLHYTVYSLDKRLAGSTSTTQPDTGTYFRKGPALAAGQGKFLGNVPSEPPESYFANYWNQLTPGNAGKWGSIAYTQDTTKWNWSNLDKAYSYAKKNHLIFKDHCLIWGAQQPAWINDLDSAQQVKYIETWIRMVGQRYPDIDMVDVVNEALAGHNPPDGQNGRANYKNALGGSGKT
jgi:endo-1,4-beta-xylanase